MLSRDINLGDFYPSVGATEGSLAETKPGKITPALRAPRHIKGFVGCQAHRGIKGHSAVGRHSRGASRSNSDPRQAKVGCTDSCGQGQGDVAPVLSHQFHALSKLSRHHARLTRNRIDRFNHAIPRRGCDGDRGAIDEQLTRGRGGREV